MNGLPEDAFMLFSVINMKLRDYYPSLSALCEDMNVDRARLEEKLSAAGFFYDAKTNRLLQTRP